MRKLTALLASLILATHLTSCTSKDSKDDESMGDEAVAESSESTDGELENLDAPADDSAVASTDGANEGFLDDQLPEDALGESNKPAEVADATTSPPADDLSLEPPADTSASAAASNDAALDEALGSVDTGSPAPVAENPADTPPAPAPIEEPAPPVAATSEPAPVESAPPADPAPAAPIAEAKPKASLKKVEVSPFNRSGVLLNAVYVARPGDNYKKISELIYGNKSKSKELAKVNPSLGSKPKAGDKVYYNSPARPTDDSKLLTFYEDAGMMPEVYVAKEGDDIKKLGKELLGYDNGWKELWVTNSVESKSTLDAGTELRYWKSAPVAAAPPPSEVAAPPAAEMAPPVPPVAEQAPPPMPDMPAAPPADMTAPPPGDMAAAPPAGDLPPPPAEMAPPPPPTADLPPPPPAEAVNPPPPPPMPKKSTNLAAEEGMDQDMMMSLAGAGIIAAGLAAIIIMRKRKEKRIEAFSDTQVGT